MHITGGCFACCSIKIILSVTQAAGTEPSYLNHLAQVIAGLWLSYLSLLFGKINMTEVNRRPAWRWAVAPTQLITLNRSCEYSHYMRGLKGHHHSRFGVKVEILSVRIWGNTKGRRRAKEKEQTQDGLQGWWVSTHSELGYTLTSLVLCDTQRRLYKSSCAS